MPKINKKTKKAMKKYITKHCSHCNQVCGTLELIDCIEDSTGYIFGHKED